MLQGIDEKDKGALTLAYHKGIRKMVRAHTRGALNRRKLEIAGQLREAKEACASPSPNPVTLTLTRTP